MTTILEINTRNFNVLECENEQVFLSYSKIYSYLSTNVSKEIAQIFAKPNIISRNDNQTELRWVDNHNQETFVQLSKLNDEEYKSSIDKLNNYIHQIEKFCLKLDEKDNSDWSDIFRKIIQYPNDKFVFVSNENRICITCWGMEEDLTVIPILPIGSDYSKRIMPEKKENEKDLTDTEQTESTENDNQEKLITDSNPIDSEPPIYTPIDSDETKSTEDLGPDIIIVRKNRIRDFLSRYGARILKYLLYLLLLLLLLFLLLRACNKRGDDYINSPIHGLPNDDDTGSRTVPGYLGGDIDPNDPTYPGGSSGLLNPIEPLIPGIPNRSLYPIDPIDVGFDDGNVKKVVLNRLNIHVEGNSDKLREFIVDFKKIYSPDEFEIIYSDVLTNRIQIQVPKNSRVGLKSDIQEKLNQYELLIWDEAIFDVQNYPADPGYSDTKKRWYLDMINASSAWNKTTGSDSIVIAVLDNGFDLSHEELVNKIYKPYNVHTRNSDVFTLKNAKHGSHVAGTAIANKDNNMGLSGIAPSCLLMPIQVSSSNNIISNTAVIDGILYAIHQGADVINLSIGLIFSPEVLKFPVQVQYDMINNTYKDSELFWDKIFEISDKNNVAIVISAGNQNILTGLDPMKRNPLGIKVSAVDAKGEKAEFSNYGAYSTISAPGVDIYSSVPGNKFEYMEGTSMAAPIVSGAIALLKSINNSLTTKQIIELLKSTGQPISDKNGKVGNLIQLDRLLSNTTNEDNFSNVNECERIRDKINKLTEEIESLKMQCPDYNKKRDTLRIPTKIVDTDFLIGKWKSTTSIINTENKQVTVYFEFLKNGNGVLELYEPNGTVCRGKLDINNNITSLLINQKNGADCNGADSYSPYEFIFKSDRNGYADCLAQNKVFKANKFNFQLIKIN